MMRNQFAFLAGAMLALGACSDHTAPDTGSDEPPSTTGSVAVQDDQFVAATIRVLQGGTVSWTWRGSNLHNVTFTGGPTSPTQTSGTFERTFDTVGTFNYLCTVHGQAMSGRITVVAPAPVEPES